MNSRLTIKCPGFDESFNSNSILMLPLSSKRDFSHPIDGKLIKRLDSPVVNAILKPIVEQIADFYQGQILAAAIPVNANSFSEIDKLVNECVRTLGIRRPYVVISNSIGFNAYTVGSDEEPHIVIGAHLVKVMSPQQLKFIIGHECGHILMGHVMYHFLASNTSVLVKMIPVIGPVLAPVLDSTVGLLLKAWSRRSEITADRAGLLCCNDLNVAKRSLLQLEAGFIDADNVNIDSYLENSRKFRNRSMLRRVGEYTADHPMLSKRIEALDLFARSKKYYKFLGTSAPLTAISDHQLEADIEKLLKIM